MSEGFADLPEPVRVMLAAEAAVRTRVGRHGIYDVTVRRGKEVIAEFRGRSATLATPP